MSVHFGMLHLVFDLGYVRSLKQKRSLISRFRSQLTRKFTVSMAETSHQDTPQRAGFTIGLVNSDARVIDAEFSQIQRWIEEQFPDLELVQEQKEII